MARATKRTNVVLGLLALLFVVVIIILCLVPRPCKGPHCRVDAQKSMAGDAHDQSYTETTSEVTTSASPSTIKVSTTMSSTTEKLTTLSSTPKAATLVTSTTEKSTSTAKTTIRVPSTTLKSTTLSSTSEGPSTVFSTTETSSSLSSADTTEEQFFLSTSEKSTTVSSTMEGSATPEESTTLSSTVYDPHFVSSATEETTTLSSTTKESTTLTPATEKLSTLSSTTSEITSYFPTQESPTLSSTTEDQYFSTSEKLTTISSTVAGSDTKSDTTEESTTLFSAVTELDYVPSTTEASTLMSTTDGSGTLSSVTEGLTTLSSTEGSTTLFSAVTELDYVPSTTEASTLMSTTDGPGTLSSVTEGSTIYSSSTEGSTTLFSAVTELDYVPSTTEASTLMSTTDGSGTLSSVTEGSTTFSSSTEGSTIEALTTLTSTTGESSIVYSTSSETLYLPTGKSPTVSSTTELSTTTTEPLFTDESTMLTSTEVSTMLTSTDVSTVLTSTEEDSATVTETVEVCNTSICKRLASRMLTKMDLGDVEPCEDFYQYSCGGVEDDPFLDPESHQLLAENLIKERLMRVNRNDSLLGPVGVFYDSCVNYIKNLNATYRLEQTKNIFSSLGYEFQDKDLIGFDKVNLTQLLAKMMKMHFTPFFDVLLDVDSNDTSMFAFKLVPPLFTSPFSDDLAKATCLKRHQQRLEKARVEKRTVNINSEYNKYTHCMFEGEGLEVRLERMEDAVKSMKLMGHISDAKLLSATRFNTNFFIEAFVKFLPKVPELRMGNLNKQYTEFTLGDLDQKGKVFNSSAIVWKDLLKELLGETVNPSSTVQVYFQKELDKILTELEVEFTSDAKNLQNMLLLMWSERIYTDLVKPVGAALDSPEHCYRVTTSLMEDFTSYLYLTALPDLPSKQEQIQRIIKQEKAVAQMELNRLFSSVTDNAFVRKLQKMSGEVADLDETKEALEANIQGITLNDNFIENSKTLIERYRTLMYSVYKKSPKNRQVMWSQFLLPYSSYGMTSYALNKFLIPYAALEAPLFYNDAPGYINYAGIGHMIAHEIAHGFDGTGVFYNGEEKENMDGALVYVGATEHLQEVLSVPWTFNSSSGLMSEFTLYRGLALNEVLADSAANRLAWETYITDVMSALTTTTEAAPALGGRGTVSRRRRSLDLYPSGSLWSTRQKRQTSYLPSLDSPEPRLPWLDLTPAQLYFLRIAQNHCSGSSEISMLTVMENEHLPPRLRINLVLKNDPLFAEAFNCQVGSGMKPGEQNPFILG